MLHNLVPLLLCAALSNRKSEWILEIRLRHPDVLSWQFNLNLMLTCSHDIFLCPIANDHYEHVLVGNISSYNHFLHAWNLSLDISWMEVNRKAYFFPWRSTNLLSYTPKHQNLQFFLIRRSFMRSLLYLFSFNHTGLTLYVGWLAQVLQKHPAFKSFIKFRCCW